MNRTHTSDFKDFIQKIMKSFKLTLAASFWLFNIELKEDLKLYMWFELYFYWKTHLKGRVTENN